MTTEQQSADEIERGLAEAIRAGHIEVKGLDANGKPLYAMTEAGIRHVQQMGRDQEASTE